MGDSFSPVQRQKAPIPHLQSSPPGKYNREDVRGRWSESSGANSMRHLTRIVGVPFGVNILGLLEIFAFVGTIFGATAASDHVPRFLGLAALVVRLA